MSSIKSDPSRLIASSNLDRTLTAVLALILLGVHAARAVTFQTDYPVEFSNIINTNSPLVTNATINNTFLEGPVWIPSDGGYLVFCNQTGNRLKKLVPPGTVTDFFVPLANTLFNGTMLDAQERLIGCEAGTGGLRVSMVTNGVSTGLVSTCNGLKFYSPNDLAVKSDGTIWFTDPGYNGNTLTPPQPGFQTGRYVYQFNPANGNATCTPVITNGLLRPNGICFSPDESKLYVADSDAPRHRIQVYTVSPSNTLTGGSVFATITNGAPDGIRCDAAGRVWSGGNDGVYIFAPEDGHLIGKILFGKVVSLCFGGPEYKTLYMVGQQVAGPGLVTSIPLLAAGPQSLKTIQSSLDGSQLNLLWPAPSTGFALQQNDQLDSPTNWTNLTPIVTNGQNLLTVETTNAAMFFRLRLN